MKSLDSSCTQADECACTQKHTQLWALSRFCHQRLQALDLLRLHRKAKLNSVEFGGMWVKWIRNVRESGPLSLIIRSRPLSPIITLFLFRREQGKLMFLIIRSRSLSPHFPFSLTEGNQGSNCYSKNILRTRKKKGSNKIARSMFLEGHDALRASSCCCRSSRSSTRGHASPSTGDSGYLSALGSSWVSPSGRAPACAWQEVQEW